jgi:hypothetical protein
MLKFGAFCCHCWNRASYYSFLHASRVPANHNHQLVSMTFPQAPVGCQAFAKYQMSEKVTESLGLSCRTEWVVLLLQGNEAGREQDADK